MSFISVHVATSTLLTCSQVIGDTKNLKVFHSGYKWVFNETMQISKTIKIKFLNLSDYFHCILEKQIICNIQIPYSHVQGIQLELLYRELSNSTTKPCLF